jgi:acyl-CoA thioester hydrolase
MSLFTFTMRKRVRWAEVDPQQVVFNPNYLTYADIGITEYLRTIGMPFPNPLAEEGTDIFAVRSEFPLARAVRR